MNKIRLLLATILSFASLGLAAAPVMAFSCSDGNLTAQQALQCGANGGTATTDTSQQATNTLQETLKTILEIFSIAVGVIAVIMVILSGFRYITSGGSQEKVTSAKNSLLYAIIGLIIVALAQVLVRFTLSKVANG